MLTRPRFISGCLCHGETVRKAGMRLDDLGTDFLAEPGGNLKTFDYRRYQRLMFDMVTLALQTDSTRVISYSCRNERDSTGIYQFMGNPYGDYHALTHHGKDANKLKWMSQVDYWCMEEWAYFLKKLKSVKEGDGTLLDHTMVAWSSPGGTVNAHNRDMLPAMLCGGRGRSSRRPCPPRTPVEFPELFRSEQVAPGIEHRQLQSLAALSTNGRIFLVGTRSVYCFVANQ